MLVRSAIGAALLVAGVVQATALTALINANERNCYYADVDGAGEKVGEYRVPSLIATAIDRPLDEALLLPSRCSHATMSAGHHRNASELYSTRECWTLPLHKLSSHLL